MGVVCEVCDLALEAGRQRRRCEDCRRMCCARCRLGELRRCRGCHGVRVRAVMLPFTEQTSDEQIWIYSNGMRVFGRPFRISDYADG